MEILLENETSEFHALPSPLDPKPFIIIQVLPLDGLHIAKQCESMSEVEDYLADVLELYGSTESFWLYEQY